MAEYSVYKAGGKMEKGGDIWNYGVCHTKSPLHMTGPCFPEYLPVHGKQWINSLFCFACRHILLSLLDCLYLNPWVFSFHRYDSLPSLKGVLVACWGKTMTIVQKAGWERIGTNWDVRGSFVLKIREKKNFCNVYTPSLQVFEDFIKPWVMWSYWKADPNLSRSQD